MLGAPVDVAPLPVDERVTAVASGRRPAFFTTVRVADERVRVYTASAGRGLAAQAGRPVTEIDGSLRALRRRLIGAVLLGAALAAVLGAAVARRAVRPVQHLTSVAEQVAATGDLSRRIGMPSSGSDDELGRLARTFDDMLGNLEQARSAQQQLVADASHELRTPLTSPRTNIETLALDADGRSDGDSTLDAAERRALLDDLATQLGEFGRLVAALVELARGAQPARAVVPVALDELIAVVVDRARSYAADGQRIDLLAQPVTVHAEVDRLDRALANVLDNAVKYGEGRPIEVTVTADEDARGVVRVRDRGLGIDARDLPHVFDRFYRAPAARDAPGSGLGLAIVQQVAEAHGGTAVIDNAVGDGAIVTLVLPR